MARSQLTEHGRHQLTEAGRNFYERGKRTIEEAEQAEAAARVCRNLARRLRVSAPVSLARLHIIPRLPALLTENPALDTEVILDDGDVDPIGSGVDLALHLDNPADSALSARKLGQSRALVVGARSHFKTHGVPLTGAIGAALGDWISYWIGYKIKGPSRMSGHFQTIPTTNGQYSDAT